MELSNTDRGNDEIDGGKGDDLIFGISIADQLLIRGGEGNDKIYAGGFDASTSTGSYYSEIDHGSMTGDSDDVIYIYGDEGHDKIYGGDFGTNFLWGGAGDDLI